MRLGVRKLFMKSLVIFVLTWILLAVLLIPGFTDNQKRLVPTAALDTDYGHVIASYDAGNYGDGEIPGGNFTDTAQTKCHECSTYSQNSKEEESKNSTKQGSDSKLETNKRSRTLRKMDEKKDRSLNVSDLQAESKSLHQQSTLPGENGMGVNINQKNLSDTERRKYKQAYGQHLFNAYVSDLISLNRSLPELRSQGCKDMHYLRTEQRVSVIICFHNEAKSVLLRTIHSVVNRSPDYLLQEIILVDDFSNLEESGLPLSIYVTRWPMVKLVRTQRHEGLVRARLLGVKLATAPIIVFLDSHVECFNGWLEPLVARLLEKRDTVVCPQIQTIDYTNFKIVLNDELYVGNFKLSDLSFDWVPLQEPERASMKNDTQCVRSPTLAGGLFAVFKDYFLQMGGYDMGMDVWGGENIELALRIWMCGGSIEIAPCSHVAHLFRLSNPLRHDMSFNFTRARITNSLRVAEVWLDEFKEFYTEARESKLSAGDVSDRKALRASLQCHSFQWYIDHVYPDLYVPGRALIRGQIKSRVKEFCVESLIDVLESNVGFTKCDGGFKQYWHFNAVGELQREVGCLVYGARDEKKLTLERCRGGTLAQTWVYDEQLHTLYHPASRLCLGLTSDLKHLNMVTCSGSDSQKWDWTDTGIEQQFEINNKDKNNEVQNKNPP